LNKLLSVLVLVFLLCSACSQPGGETPAPPPVSDGSYSILDNNEPEVTYEWKDILLPDNRRYLGDESFSEQLTLPFSFEFFGISYDKLFIHSNGFLTLQGSVSGTSYSPRQVPDSGGVNAVIAGLWADLDQSLNDPLGYVIFGAEGTEPDRSFIVTYHDIPYGDDSCNVTFQIILYETSNEIKFQYQDFETDGRKHTQGIENEDGTKGCFVSGRNLYNFTLPDEYAVTFFPQ